MLTSRDSRKRVFWLVMCLLGCIVTACGGASPSSSSSPANFGNNNQPGAPGQSHPTYTSMLSVQMPVTRTDCPLPMLSGRTPVMRAMAQGHDPAVVYINDQGTTSGPNSFGEIKLYNTVTGAPTPGSKVLFGKSVIAHIPNSIITEAQISADGQWVLFVTQTVNAAEIQMVRVDGQGLQTLYCAPPGTIQSVQWSPDASRFLFSQEAISGLLDLYLFDMTSGRVQPELVQKNDAALGYEARTWLDNNRAYIIGVTNPFPASPTARGLFVLDTGKGLNQQPSDLTSIVDAAQSLACRSFDSDYNATVLVMSRCSQSLPANSNTALTLEGPSSITRQGITGGSTNTIYFNKDQAVTQVRMLGHSSDTMLLAISTINPTNGGLANAKSGPNGLWKMKLDGSGLVNLVQSDPFSECELNQFTQYPWSNISLDNRLYAVEIQQVVGKSAAITLQIGSLSSSNTGIVSFEYGSANQGLLAIAGWTSV